MLVSIITPTTGNPLLKKAVESVQGQDYENIEHFIVIDGKQRAEATHKALSDIKFTKPYHILTLPCATGASGYKGHRIYGGVVYLVNGDYIIYLDEDNWFEPYHVSSLVDLVYQQKLDWAYALRNIVNPEGEFITQDNCESLGKYRVFTNYNHVDTNCYFIKKDIAIKSSKTWYKKGRKPGEGTMSVDMILCAELLKQFPNCNTNGLYSVNYRLGSTPRTIKAPFFLHGNSLVQQHFPNGYPWCKDLPNYHKELQGNLQLRDKNFITFPDWQVEDSELIKNDLVKLVEAILNHPEKTKINLLIFVQESLAEEAGLLLWDLMLNHLNLNGLESDLPEITMTHEMSPVRWSYLLPSLTGYVTIDHQDSNLISQTVQDQVTGLKIEEIVNY
ncbi:MAG: glycosyltransferase [Crocosphaera sp.]